MGLIYALMQYYYVLYCVLQEKTYIWKIASLLIGPISLTPQLILFLMDQYTKSKIEKNPIWSAVRLDLYLAYWSLGYNFVKEKFKNYFSKIKFKQIGFSLKHKKLKCFYNFAKMAKLFFKLFCVPKTVFNPQILEKWEI